MYLFGLDKFHDENSEDPVLRQHPFVIDGEYMSGPTRFMNHSCSPNCKIFAVVEDLAMKCFHKLAFFALEDIPRYTELTFDYSGGIVREDSTGGRNRQDDEEPEIREETRCLCGAENCRGYIW